VVPGAGAREAFWNHVLTSSPLGKQREQWTESPRAKMGPHSLCSPSCTTSWWPVVCWALGSHMTEADVALVPGFQCQRDKLESPGLSSSTTTQAALPLSPPSSQLSCP
jgi:hypothetical protein